MFFKKNPRQTLDIEDKYVGKILKRFEVIWIIFFIIIIFNAASVSLYFSISNSNEIWSVCVVCINVWELPWYQCCVGFLVFQDKHQTESVLLGEKGRVSQEGWRDLSSQSLCSLTSLLWLGELSRWKGLGQGEVFPLLQLQNGILAVSVPWDVEISALHQWDLSRLGAMGLAQSVWSTFLLCSCALPRVKGGREQLPPAPWLSDCTSSDSI